MPFDRQRAIPFAQGAKAPGLAGRARAGTKCVRSFGGVKYLRLTGRRRALLGHVKAPAFLSEISMVQGRVEGIIPVDFSGGD